MKPLGNEPQLILNAISAAIGLVVTLGVTSLTTDQAGAIVAVITAVFAAVAAALTRPVAVGAFTALAATAFDLLAAFHFNVAPGTLGAVNMLVVAVLTLIARGHVAPVSSLRAVK